MDSNSDNNMDFVKEEKQPLRLRSNFLWIIFVFIGWYEFIAGIFHVPYFYLLNPAKNPSVSSLPSGLLFTLEYYAGTFIDIVALFLLTWLVKKNRYIWKSFLLPKKNTPELLTEDDIAADLYGRPNNGFRMLGLGLLLGFLTNFACILCAMLHGDIKLYFEVNAADIPIFVFALFCVCIQSTAEELWCRGFLYERLHERYPLWVSIFINGVLFGMMHLFNPGVSALPIIGIVICGFSYSLLRWYSGSIWIAMGIHTGWNFTQNYLFGLPNSGLISECSFFHLDAANGATTLIYDYVFGIEGGIPAVVVDAFIGIVCLILAARAGRLKELGMSRANMLEQKYNPERSSNELV